MGREAKTIVDDGRTRAEARLHLDSEMLAIGPPFRLKLRLDGIKSCIAGGDDLTVRAGDERLSIALPAKEAAAWAKSMLNPPSLATKLGVKAGMRVASIGAMPEEVLTVAPDAERFDGLPKTLAETLVLAAVPGAVAERDLAKLRAAMASGSAVWLVYEKGITNGDTLIFAARAAGLKDTKVARISDRFAALRFITA
jgi:hypothetical protein